jgi:hypothetical protein
MLGALENEGSRGEAIYTILDIANIDEEIFKTVKNLVFSIPASSRWAVLVRGLLAKKTMHVGDTLSTTKVLEEIRTIAYSDDGDDDNVYSFARLLAEFQRFEEAYGAAQDVQRPVDKACVLAFIASKQLSITESKARETFNEAANLAEKIESFGQWEPGLHYWVSALMENGYFAEALRYFKPGPGRKFPEAVADWADILESLGAGIMPTAFGETVRIAGWVDLGWHEIYDLLR